MADENGCHPEQYRGEWAIEPKEFDRLVGIANRAMDSGYLSGDQVAARAAASASQGLYAVGAGGVATIDINGPLTKYQNSFQSLFGGTATVRARQALREASRDPDVRGIFLRIDSPGGTVAGTADLADEVARADKRKPVYAYFEDLAASGALWVGVQARKVFANEGALVGSIGVLSTLIDSSEAAGRQGIKVRVVSTAPLKGAKSAGVPITEAVIAEEQRVIDSIGDLFVAAVADGRGITPEQARALATGQVWIASEAKGLGLVDEIATLEEAQRALMEESMKEEDAKAALAAAEDAKVKLASEKQAREQAETTLADVQKRLQALETEKRTARFTAEAEALGTPKAFSGTLDAIEAAVGPEVYGALQTQLRAYHAQVKDGKLFSETGSNAPSATGTAMEQIEALAKAKVEKGEAKTLPLAIAAVTRDRPELARQHRVEQRKGAN